MRACPRVLARRTAQLHPILPPHTSAHPQLVWTRSGTGALHNLGETFPWERRSRFAYLSANHNSVLGIRE